MSNVYISNVIFGAKIHKGAKGGGGVKIQNFGNELILDIL